MLQLMFFPKNAVDNVKSRDGERNSNFTNLKIKLKLRVNNIIES